MINYEMASAIRMVFGVAAILFVCQYILMPTLTERFRNNLFSLRREAFVLMAQGRIAPTHPAYTSLRRTINGTLRFAERMTFLRFLASGLLFRPVSTEETSDRIKTAINTIDDEDTRKMFSVLRVKFAWIIVLHMLRTSPLLWLILALCAIPAALVVIAGQATAITQKARLLFRGLEEEVQGDAALA